MGMALHTKRESGCCSEAGRSYLEGIMNGGEFLLRALRWSIRRLGRQNLFTWTLMLVAVLILIQGLVNNVRDLEAGLLWSIALLGLLLGWVISRWRENKIYTLVVALLAGWLVIVLRVGNLESLALRGLYALNTLLIQNLRWGPGLPYPDAGPFLEFLAEFIRRTGVLTSRVFHWAQLVLGQGVPSDPVAIAAAWSAAIWLVAFWTAWNFCRSQFIRGLVPITALLGAVLSFSGQNGFLLIPLFCIALVMNALNAYTSHILRWQKENIDYSEDTGFDLSVAVTFVLSVLVVAALLAPLFSFRRIADFMREVTRVRQETRTQGREKSPEQKNSGPQIGLALGLQPHPSPTAPSAFSRLISTGMPQEHLLGTGAELSQRVVMVVSITQQTALNAPQEEAQLSQAAIVDQKPYWQAVAYDIYLGSGWATSTATQIRYTGGQAALSTEAIPGPSLLIHQSVQYVGDSFQPGGLIYTTGDLVEASQDYMVAWRNPPGKAVDNPPVDIFSAASPAIDYQAISYLQRATAQQLREAGTLYPSWIRQHYLQLPKNLPARVHNLAIKLTATEATPFDQARAIEQYLRAFTYTLQLPIAPTNVDLVDYFLFELKKGYCDYDASAMVVLARAAGLPARLVIGYATGTYDEAHQRFVITEADAHSWPEIYFPGYGWYRFEPTGGRPNLDRPASTESSIEVPQIDSPQTTTLYPGTLFLKVTALFLAGLLLLALAGLLLWFFSEPWRLARIPAAASIQRVYQQIHNHTLRLEKSTPAGVTPAELCQSLVEMVERVQGEIHWVGYFENVRGELEQIVKIYNQQTYSAHTATRDSQLQTIAAWSRLRGRLLLALTVYQLPVMRKLMRHFPKSGTISIHK
jgi:transglutaminase-like putative cysteine protease